MPKKLNSFALSLSLCISSERDLSHLPDFTHNQLQPFQQFLQKWGTAVLHAAIEGGTLEITMSERKDRASDKENIKNSLGASYFGLASLSPSIQSTLEQSKADRDGYWNLLVSGGSKETRAAVQHRFERMMSPPLDPSVWKMPPPNQLLSISPLVNITSLWSTSVEEGHSVITKGRYITFDR